LRRCTGNKNPTIKAGEAIELASLGTHKKLSSAALGEEAVPTYSSPLNFLEREIAFLVN
jgi:hypothetical protein